MDVSLRLPLATRARFQSHTKPRESLALQGLRSDQGPQITHTFPRRAIAAQFVTPFRKGRKIENGQADVGSTATATRQNNIRFMPAKSSNRQGRLPSHRVREEWNVEARVMGRRISGLLAELG